MTSIFLKKILFQNETSLQDTLLPQLQAKMAKIQKEIAFANFNFTSEIETLREDNERFENEMSNLALVLDKLNSSVWGEFEITDDRFYQQENKQVWEWINDSEL